MIDEAKNARSIFLEIVEKAPRERWAESLEQACGDDDQLRIQVQRLLNAHEVIGGFMDRPAADPPQTIDVPMTEQPGTVIGPYKLLQQIGEGGMGTVYMAEQQKPVRRRVALKIIKPGMDSRQVIARFEAERQALAMMDHPNIARVLDAGCTENGRPYFAMELVQGVPITQYCDDKQFSPRERLELFVEVCHAVQHAHQKGIIHRDLKPSNVLIAIYDGKPIPKIIDFGVAKALHQQLTEKTMFTQFGAVVGTLEYMSPEQADMDLMGTDTRSDIYSLGVLLYELLTGTTPMDGKQLRSLGYAEMLKTIREEDPPKPSTRLSQSTESLPAVAAQRKTEPARLSKMFRGDLDWITMKALEKDRTRRYETASGLAADVLRYLHDEPVEASPPSAAYRLKKLARRYRGALATASAVVAILIVAVIVSTFSAIQANRAKEDALRAENEERQQRTLAEAERNRAMEAERKAKANAALAETNLVEANRQKELADGNFRQAKKAVDQYLTHVGEDPELVDNPDLAPLRDKLFESALAFYQSFAAVHTEDPTLQAEQAAAHMRVARIKHAQGKRDEWIPELEKSHRLVAALVDEGVTREQLESLSAGVSTNRDQSVFQYPSDVDSAVRVLQQGATTWGILVSRYPDIPGLQADLAEYCHLIAILEFRRGRQLDAASGFLRGERLLENLVAKYPADAEYRMTLTVFLTNNALYLLQAGQNSAALETALRAVALAEKVNEEFPGRPYYKRHLCQGKCVEAKAQIAAGHPREAEAAYRRSVAGLEELVAKYPRTIQFRRDLASYSLELGVFLAENNRLDDAIALWQRPSEADHGIDNLPANDPQRVETRLQFLGGTYVAAAAQQAWFHKDNEYADTCRRALELGQRSDDPVTLERVAKACMLRPSSDTGRLANSLAFARKAVELGKGHGFLRYFQMALGICEFRNGHWAEADVALVAAMKTESDKSPIWLTSAFYRAMNLFQQGKRDEAQRLANEATARMKPLPREVGTFQNPDDLILWMAYKEATELLKLDSTSAGSGRPGQ
jgi:serine/threonine protein kinase/tetratricopeptide (TPR) repeat protein